VLTEGSQTDTHGDRPGGLERVGAEEGFGLIEMLMATTLFLCVSAPLVGVLLASVAQQKLSRERTLAAQTAQTAIESIRALPYNAVGTQNGNPAGTVPESQPANQFGIPGLDATVTTRISYMDDAPSTAYRTRADYKRVVVTVVRNADSRRLTQDVTYVAPPGGGTYAGQNEGIVLAQVIDAALNTPVVGASVSLSGGPTPTRTDTADASGSVVFPALLPTTTLLNHYDVTAAMPGYATLREDTPPSSAARTSLAGGQTFQTIIRMYKPSTITVVPHNADNTAYMGQAIATISSTRGTQSFSFSGGLFTLAAPQTLAGEPVVPNVQYTVRVLAANGGVTTAMTQAVPTSYPTDLTKTFDVTLGAAAAMQALTVKVVDASGAKVPGATVAVSGGPGSNVMLVATTDANGTAVFGVPANSSPGYTTSATSGALTGSASGAVTAATTRTVTIR
jgi:type II secretory pathway pseudopilin PulG